MPTLRDLLSMLEVGAQQCRHGWYVAFVLESGVWWAYCRDGVVSSDGGSVTPRTGRGAHSSTTSLGQGAEGAWYPVGRSTFVGDVVPGLTPNDFTEALVELDLLSRGFGVPLFTLHVWYTPRPLVKSIAIFVQPVPCVVVLRPSTVWNTWRVVIESRGYRHDVGQGG